MSRCCQSGVRWPGRRRGMRSARAAFSRKRDPKSALRPTSWTTRFSSSSGSTSRSARAGGASASGRWSAMPSSDHSDCASSESVSRSLAASAIDQGACTRPPNGVRMQTRQSPISSRNRSTTTVLSVGSALERSCSRRNTRRFLEASSSRWYVSRRRFVAFASERAASSRDAAPIRAPSSYGLPTPSPFQNGTAPGTPGAGVTSTRSRVISSILQVEAPSMNVWPSRAS